VHGDLVMRGVEVVLETAAALPAMQGDRVGLQQVMLNLVVNACEAMSGAPEGRRLTIRTRADEAGVHISFTDRGSGFHPDDYHRLFEPFYTTKAQGLGLGLSISRSILSAHGGRLWGTATPGQGASFHILLPAQRAGAIA
jgi:C4-dicarboxylate-specific signal transduction histidine kinase